MDQNAHFWQLGGVAVENCTTKFRLILKKKVIWLQMSAALTDNLNSQNNLSAQSEIWFLALHLRCMIDQIFA